MIVNIPAKEHMRDDASEGTMITKTDAAEISKTRLVMEQGVNHLLKVIAKRLRLAISTDDTVELDRIATLLEAGLEPDSDQCICTVGSVFVNPKCCAKEHRP
jgi:hypothetical protein